MTEFMKRMFALAIWAENEGFLSLAKAARACIEKEKNALERYR